MPGTHTPAVDLRRQLLWMIALRAIIVTGLLGTSMLVQVNAPGVWPIHPVAALIGVNYALTLLFAVTLGYSLRHPRMIDVQLACDALTASGFVFLTGGILSYFSSLYVLPVIAASVIQSRRGGLKVAALSATVYTGGVLLQYLHRLPGLPTAPELLPEPRVALYMVALNVFGFAVVALLSGYLAEGLRRAGARLEHASTRIADLEVFNERVIASMTSGLVTADAAGRVTTFNRAAESITGQRGASVLGQGVADVLQLPDGFAAELRLGFGDRSGRRADYPYTRADGRRIEIGVSVAPLMSASDPAGLIFTFQDITELLRLEREARLQQRLAAVGQMAAGIAHEIRNPLASISGSIQILRQELALSTEQAQLMDIVLRESERLNDTIRSFLAYARPQRLATTRVDVRRVLRDAATLLRNSSEYGSQHRIELELPDGDLWYDADEGQLKQILWNLATNGLRAMPGGGRLHLSAMVEPDTRGVEAMVLGVRDEGVGIPAGELDAIFQPFRGAFSKGTGLGLAIVHRIVSDYRGEIQVTSEAGSGTTVKIRFPAGVPVTAR